MTLEDEMGIQVFDIGALKRFDDRKQVQETIWSDDHGRISMICMKPGQEIHTHTHHGNHVWTVIEGEGELLTGSERRPIRQGEIVVVPPFEHHGIRNGSEGNLVIASFTTLGD